MRHLPTIIVASILSLVAMDVLAADPTPQLQPGAPTQTVQAPVSPLAALPLERLSATRERPLFSPTRRPPAPPPPLPPPPPAPPPDVALLAVIMDGEDARAVVRAGPVGKIMRVQIGDDIDGWKVGQIEARQLVLLLDDRRATFTMFTGNGANGPPGAGAGVSPSSGPSQNPMPQSPPASSTSAPPNAGYAPVRRTRVRR